MDARSLNRIAWDEEVSRGNEWTVPVTPEAIAAARQGRWNVVLTPIKPVPTGRRDQLLERRGMEVLLDVNGEVVG